MMYNPARDSQNKFIVESVKEETPGSILCSTVLVVLSYTLIVITFPLSICYCFKVVQEYERCVIFRLGRNSTNGPRGPGLFFILPCIDSIIKLDLRTVTFDVPPQEILTKDSVTITVDAVIYFKLFDPVLSVNRVTDAQFSTRLLAATTLRNILGTKTLQEILQDKESLSQNMQRVLDAATHECKHVRLPTNMQRVMATEAEASREAKAKVVSANGEKNASIALKNAANTISENPVAIQLRYLQVLTQVAAERNSTIIFPIPIEFVRLLSENKASQKPPVTITTSQF